MYPDERSLVKRLEGKSFALLGINSDADKEALKKAMEKEGITWRSWWNGPEGPSGPLAKAWNIRGWPTIYVLDAKGVIRFKYLGGKELDDAVEGLVKEVKQETK